MSENDGQPPAPAKGRSPDEARWPVLEWVSMRPRVRRFLSTHEVHFLPHRVSHSRRFRRAVFAAGAALLILAAWWWVIPRTDVVVEAQYHEGLFNSIAVDARVVNGGTVALSPLHVRIVVTDLTTNGSVGFLSFNTTLAPHRTLDLNSIEFKGDQVTTSYAISVLISFDASGGRVTKALDFRTEEPYMNLYFSGRVA